jgi:hypothetical protein
MVTGDKTKRAIALAPLVLGAGWLAERSISSVFAKLGHPGAALDDAYIHFQYARAIAEGHPLRFQAGAPITSGATSLLWPALLAPFWALGARGEAILWPAWCLSFAALGALAWEAMRLTERLAGRVAGAGAAAMTLAFGGFTWCASSGMEVVPFAWSIARTARLVSEWAEEERRREPRGAAELVAMAWVASLFRPEGAVSALLVAVTLACFRPRTLQDVDARARARAAITCGAWAGTAALGAFAVPLLLWVLTGSPRSTTAVAKLLPGNPYFAGPALVAAVEANAEFLTGNLLNGERLSFEFLPHGGAPVALAGLGAVAALGLCTRRTWRAGAVLLLALTMFAPCFYYTFIWNRLRYLWPFATGWIVGLACLARLVGDVAGWVRPRWRAATGLVCGAFAGLLASKLESVIDDVAQSASGIDRQQVALGRWAKEMLPLDARIGLNDTGAIAYFSDRATFDVVGLTTRGEAPYWVAGAGSRFEHYERLVEERPLALPTHFIVYPEWLRLDAVLGAPLHEATVTDSTILGGVTMRAYLADWSKLGSGERPWSDASEPLDTLDVADLESEAAHAYELLGARDSDDNVHEGESPDGATVVDGGRSGRADERFVAHLPAGVQARCIVRLDAPPGTRIQALAGGRALGEIEVGDAPDWVERSFALPADVTGPATRIELRTSGGGPVTVFHYWFVRAS